MKRDKLERRRLRSALTLITPSVILMVILLIGPALFVLLLSLTNWQLGSKSFDWVGLRNYGELFGDAIFRRASLNTLIYTLVVVPLSVILGLGAALLIQSTKGLTSFYRAALFLPVMSTFVAMVIVWEYMLHPSFGVVNTLLSSLGFAKQDFLRNENLVLYTLAAIGIWQQTGYNMVLFLSGLSGINRELYQAADVDGARGFWDSFSLVTRPQLAPISLFVIVISAIRSFQVFESVHVLTQGGPNNASEVMIYTMFEEGFRFFRTGYASAISIIFLGAVLIITIVKSRIIERRIHY
ncbi:MAG: sugar ABC transporter permease [Spirochaetales bacterium]|nr:sugar ABC transporter permease [Spirochaetales bacterium]